MGTPPVLFSLGVFNESTATMEQFLLSAQHSGTINHVHSFHLPTAAPSILKEIRITVAILSLAWVTVEVIRRIGPRSKNQELVLASCPLLERFCTLVNQQV